MPAKPAPPSEPTEPPQRAAGTLRLRGATIDRLYVGSLETGPAEDPQAAE